MGRHKRVEFSQQAFAERLEKALEMNPNAPPKFQGERVWLVEQMLKHGLSVTTETVRKWIAGTTMPSHDKVPTLARVLGVDADWLLYGADAAEEARLRVQHSVDAAAATNLVAGIIQIHGGDAVFPTDAKRGSAHLHAVIKRVSYPLHIVMGEMTDGGLARFELPMRLDDAIAIGVIAAESGFSYRLFEIDESLATVERSARVVETDLAGLREITSFAERL